jgi:hypothetical protein
LHKTFLKGVMQREENSSKMSPAIEFDWFILLKRTADYSLIVEEINTKYLLVKGVRVRRGVVPKYSFY